MPARRSRWRGTGKLALFRTYGDAKTEPAKHAGHQRHAVPAVQRRPRC